MIGMPYKIKSIVTRKLEGVNHFHNYLCRQLKGGGMEIFMKTPWMQANYRKLDNYDFDLNSNDEDILILKKGNNRYQLTKEEYNDLLNNNLDFLKMENLYYRGMAFDDEGEICVLSDENVDIKYIPLDKKEYVKIPVKTEKNDYFVILNPNVGSWVAMTEEEIADYESGRLDKYKMENLYVRKLARDTDKEFVEMDFPKPAERPSVIVVNLTMTCNLRCKYCFAACEPGAGDFMSKDVMKRVIEQMFQMPSKLITFELQGGEPLCYLEGMKMFVEISEGLKERYSKLVKYRTVTNATLVSDDFIQFAKKYNVAVCVSLDGDEEMTNQTRVYANGKGAFSEIIKGVHKLKEEYEIDGSVCTIGQHNMNEAERIMNFFIEQGISFKPRPANLLGRELENHTTTNSGQWADAFIKMHKLSEDAPIENYSVHIHEENVFGPVRDYICLRYPCGAAREVISVNPDGTVYPCDGFKNEQEFNMGNIIEESLEDILSKDWVLKLRDRTHKDIEKCSKCTFRAMCCSCCYSAYGAYGTIYREDPQCEDRRKIFLYLIKDWIEKHE